MGFIHLLDSEAEASPFQPQVPVKETLSVDSTMHYIVRWASSPFLLPAKIKSNGRGRPFYILIVAAKVHAIGSAQVYKFVRRSG